MVEERFGGSAASAAGQRAGDAKVLLNDPLLAELSCLLKDAQGLRERELERTAGIRLSLKASEKLDASGAAGPADGRTDLEEQVRDRVELLKGKVMKNLYAVQTAIEAELDNGPMTLGIKGFMLLDPAAAAARYRESIVAYWNATRGCWEPDRLKYAAALRIYCKDCERNGRESPLGDVSEFQLTEEALAELAELVLRELAIKEVASGQPADPLPLPDLDFGRGQR